MFSIRLANAQTHLSRCSTRQLTSHILPNTRLTLRNSLRHPCLRRSYAKPAEQSEAIAARQAARNASQKVAEDLKKKETLALPRTQTIFHAGAVRVTFIALLKVTSLLMGAFFVGIVTPTYVRSNKSITQAGKVAFYGLFPPLMIAYLTAPFVTHMRVKLPPTALGNKANLDKFIKAGGLKDTELLITTMSLIATPRTASVRVGELMPTHQRWGLINYIRRDNPRLEEQRKTRKWYHFRPVTNFYLQSGRPGEGRKVRYADTKKGPVEWAVWEEIKKHIPLPTAA